MNVNKHISENIQGEGQERYSNLELFRIITMLCIIAHHYVVNSGIMQEITSVNVLNANSLFALVFGWGGKTGINCFVLITGYFMCKSNISFKKFLKLFLETEFYQICFYIIFIITGYETFNLKIFIKTVLPIYYIGTEFLSSYLVFFFFIPYLNILIHAMTEKQHLYLIGYSLFVDTILQTFFKAPVAFTYVGWFIVLYFIASYIRFCSDKDYNNKWILQNLVHNKKLWRRMTIGAILLSWCSVVAGAVVLKLFGKKDIYYFVADSNKLLALVTSVCAFLFFKNLKLRYHKVINTIAASVFGVLLIHTNSDMMRRWLWGDLLGNVKAYHVGSGNMGFFVVHAFGSIVIIYCVCTMIDMVRINFLEKPFFKCYEKHFCISTPNLRR